jgi:uncharacterized protein YjbI with pentapeptide repeats
MNAKQIIARYNAGERDFKRLNLRGMNFQGVNLSGADFSECDLRSTNFHKATLRKTNFTQIKGGLQKKWYLCLLLISFLASIVIINGYYLFVSLYTAGLLFLLTNQIDDVATKIVLSVLCIDAFSMYLISTLLAKQKGVISSINEILETNIIVGIIIGIFSGFFLTFAIVNESNVSIPIVVLLLILGLLSFLFALLLTVGKLVSGVMITFVLSAGAVIVNTAAAVAGNIAAVISGLIEIFGAMISGFSAIMIVRAIADKNTSSGLALEMSEIMVMLAIAFAAFFWVYIGWRAWIGDTRDSWMRDIAVAYGSLGGTCFRGADLTDADFTGARLKNTDFREAKLVRTIWKDSIKLDQVRPGKSYLGIKKIRELLLTKKVNPNEKYSNLVNLDGLNLEKATLIGADFSGSNLSYSNLQGANLSDANLITTNLNDADLKDANLSRAKLVQTQLDNTDLTGAILTGACIEDWGITTPIQI